MGRCDRIYRDLLLDLFDGSRVFTRNSEVLRIFPAKAHFHQTPLVSLRETAWKNALREWQWFMSGSCDIDDLHPAVRKWWEPWADHRGSVECNYSMQFRKYGDVCDFDQIEYLVEGIKDHPYSRRNVITTWHTQDMSQPYCPITNCHGTVIQAFVEPDNSLHLATYQRSADVVCGLPHNWAQYWAFLMWLAHRGGRKVGSLTWIGGDVHLYLEHKDLAERIVAAAKNAGEVPELVYTPTSEEFLADDFTLSGPYTPLIQERARMVV